MPHAFTSFIHTHLTATTTATTATTSTTTSLLTAACMTALMTGCTSTDSATNPDKSKPVAQITVDTTKPGHTVSPTMFGLFFEDINYAADGGLYAELVQNRSFEHDNALHAWSLSPANPKATLTVANQDGLNANNPQYAQVKTQAAATLTNIGFDGMAIKAGQSFDFSVFARGSITCITAELQDDHGHSLGQVTVNGITQNWQKIQGVLKATQSNDNAKLVIHFKQSGQLDLDVVSLFPQHTFKNRPNGMRADLSQILADLNPGFLRFPGGCIVEGERLSNAYRWKDTVGPIETRKQNWNRWQNPDNPEYYQTYGLGFFEYFQLSEDLNAEPVPILNCGMSCQFQSDGKDHVHTLVPTDELDEYIQDALDLIEFANGDTNTQWGKLRADMGHPEPFNLKYLGIGNEQWGPEYFERYRLFYNTIKAKHPEIILITTSGPGVDDGHWQYAWELFRDQGGVMAEIVDEHYYRSPEWFLQNTHRYDEYPREGNTPDQTFPKVFAGEFAAHGPDRDSTLYTAITEAAYMTGLLRNADLVTMAAYAPLLAKEKRTQWRPDLIYFNNTQAYGTTSYYVQKLYAENRPTYIWPTTVEQPKAKPVSGQIGLGTWNTQVQYKDIQVTLNDGDTIVFDSNQANALTNLQMDDSNNWTISPDGVLNQTSRATPAFATIGNTHWQNYTLTLKAKKTGGSEGFLIGFLLPNEKARHWWNIGGWGNSGHGVQYPGIKAPRVPGKIQTDRWYDIKIQAQGNDVAFYLDNQLIHQGTIADMKSIHAISGYDQQTGETVLTVVNSSDNPMTVTLDLGSKPIDITDNTTLTIFTSDHPTDMNSFDEPTRVVPKTQTMTLHQPIFNHTLPPYAMHILRVKTQP